MHTIVSHCLVLVYIYTVRGSSGCHTFDGLPAGVHSVRAISRGSGSGGGRLKSDFYYFSTK